MLLSRSTLSSSSPEYVVANTVGSTIRTLTFLPPPPWTSHLSYAGQRCWLGSHTLTSSPAVLLQTLARAGCEWEQKRLDDISFAIWSSFSPQQNRMLGAELLWRTGGLGQDSLREMLSRGDVCLYGPCLRGLIMSSMLACLLCCPIELLLYGAGRLCLLGEKRVWLQLLQPEIRRGWTRKAKSAKVWVENYLF